MRRCKECPDNTYSAEQAGICVTCPPGSRANLDHSSCGENKLFRKLRFRFSPHFEAFNWRVWSREKDDICPYLKRNQSVQIKDLSTAEDTK